MEIKRNLVDSSKYSIKCPYEMVPSCIVVHNTANDASAENEIAYMRNNDEKVSFHYAVDDKEIVQGVEENRNTWNAGDGTNGEGNRKGIAIEICYSKSGGERFEEAERKAVELIVDILNRYNWGVERVKKHQDFNGKYCPHRTLDMGWERFLNMVREKLGQAPVQEKQEESVIKQWQKVMNECYGCNLVIDGSFGPDCTAKANQYYLYYKIPTIKNAHVKFMQERLNSKGYLTEIDGSYGPDNEAKVKQFQKANNLTADGFVGPATTKLLLN